MPGKRRRPGRRKALPAIGFTWEAVDRPLQAENGKNELPKEGYTYLYDSKPEAEQTRMLFRFHFRFLPDRTFISTYSPTAITMAAASTKYMAGSATLSPKKYRLQSTLSRMASTT